MAGEQQLLTYKMRAEKSVANEVVLMKWSPKMDVVALAFSDKSVVLNRLSWQRVWSIEPSDTMVTSLEWRPDGKVLCVGYTSGLVSLHSIDDGKCIHTLPALCQTEVTKLLWIEKPFNKSANDLFNDASEQYMSSLPSLENNVEDVLIASTIKSKYYPDDPKCTTSHASTSNLLNVLFIADKSGKVHITIFGILCVTSLVCSKGHVIDMCISPDFKSLVALVCVDKSIHFKMFDIGVVMNQDREFYYITINYTRIICVLEYIEEILQSMVGSWEDSLSSVHLKMKNYAETLPPSLTIMDEFIILLACGQCRTELKAFLLNDLTAAGIKKIGLSLEMSYKTFRRFMINHIEKAVQSLNLYLHDTLAMISWNDKFGSLGIVISYLEDCVKSLNCFALKSQEFLFIIDESLHNMKTFFIWLYTTIVKLSGDTLPFAQEGPTPEDLKMIVNFLKSRFKPLGHDQTFSLDKVGQYLLKEDLKIIKESSSSMWNSILTESGLKDLSWLVMDEQPNKSLRQLFDSLRISFDTAFGSCKDYLKFKIGDGAYLEFPDNINEFELTDHSTKVFYHNEDCICYIRKNEYILVTKYNEKTNIFNFGKIIISYIPTKPELSNYTICDVSYYNSEAISILFSCPSTHHQQYFVAQLPITAFVSVVDSELFSTEREIGSDLLEVTDLGRFQAKRLIVSGSRKLAAIISTGGKRIQIFDVDVEEDEDEEGSQTEV